jgi:2,3-bisphosphoglycerate-dependent phosphoglycerate mutase
MTRLIIARHGNNFNAGEIVRRIGTTDLPLVASGIEQGKRLAHHLINNELRPNVIFTSELKRTKQMAGILCDIAAENIPIFANAIFNEIDYGIDENQPETNVAERLGAKLKLWEEQAIAPEEWRVNQSSFINNWQVFATQILQDHKNETILVITSNGIARFAPHLGGDFEAFRLNNSIKLATGCFGLMRHNSEKWIIESWNKQPD